MEQVIVDPYENQLIGAFLLAFGLVARSKNTGLPEDQMKPVWANLLQQTPADKDQGDLIIGLEKFIAIEFKRFDTSSDIRNERNKWNYEELTNSVKEKYSDISSSCHFLVYGVKESEHLMHFTGFVNALKIHPNVSPGRRFPDDKPIGNLISNMISPIGDNYGTSKERLAEYLEDIRKHRRTSAGGTTKAHETSFLGVGLGGIYGFAFFEYEIYTELLNNALADQRKLQAQNALSDKAANDLPKPKTHSGPTL